MGGVVAVTYYHRSQMIRLQPQLNRVSRSAIPVVYIKTAVDQRSGKWQSKIGCQQKTYRCLVLIHCTNM